MENSCLESAGVDKIILLITYRLFHLSGEQLLRFSAEGVTNYLIHCLPSFFTSLENSF
jgi:hypothetical protein